MNLSDLSLSGNVSKCDVLLLLLLLLRERERDASAAVKYVLRDIEARTTEVHSESYGCSYASLSTINTPILQD